MRRGSCLPAAADVRSKELMSKREKQFYYGVLLITVLCITSYLFFFFF
jgi:hypothetical protein